ncbi:Nif11-like leader peptide family RiPP precursor, partial [Synechococcus sp. MU1655]|uniref:Nif11-like leader peptide family RiPP precursor n=1 Tax=Synechococcus sp. MU1655 TaxID=2508355 RepID=UPI00202645DF
RSQEPMSEEQLNAFREKVQSDVLLQGQLKVAADVEAVAAIAAENGFHLKPDNALRMLMWEFQEAELEGGD